MTTLRLGTRRSTLALAQATEVADRLGALGHDVDLVPLTTLGDQSSHALTTIGGTGVFAAAIRRALLDGEIDLAVHSLKDLPTAPEPGLVVAATPTREDPRDVLVARDGLTLGELPAGSVVGTGSPRRAAQLRALGLGLDVVPVRGNVDTRLELVRSSRVSTLPRTGTTSSPRPRAPSWAARRGEPVPTTDPAGSSPRVRPSRATRTSRGSSRVGVAATTRPGSGAVGRSLSEWTARSISPSSSARADGGREHAGAADRGQRVRRLVAERAERDEVDVVAELTQPVGHQGGLGEGESAAAGAEAEGRHGAPPSSWCTAVGGVDTAATVWGSRSNSSRSAAA